jgi:IS605 OrfB family transposase
VDSNPAGPAATIVSRDGNLVDHKFFRDPRLIHASAEKREQIIGETVGRIMEWALGHGAETFVAERLDIKNDKSFNRRANRIIRAFVRRKFSETLSMQCWKHNTPMAEVNPAYTSKIGKAKYLKRLGLSIHEAAALCIGRRFYGYGERLEEPMTITVKNDERKGKVPVMYVWASIYGHGSSADPSMEPPRRKGSLEWKPAGPDGAVFTGRPATERSPLSLRGCELVRKGGECGESPQATGNGVKPAPPKGGGEAAAEPLDTNDI